jgi:HAD superfamily hydrolase (TIGR01549 family)
MSILGVIFDLDGTLVDSRLDFNAMRREIGLPDGTPVLEGTLALTGSQAERAWQIVERHERIGAETATVIPGVDLLLAELRLRHIHTAVVTRNSKTFVRNTIDRLRLGIDLVFTRDDAPPKPNPAALQAIVRHWQLLPSRVAMIGDYLFDLEAGRAAGTRTVLYAADATAAEVAAWRPLADFIAESFVPCNELLGWLETPDSA